MEIDRRRKLILLYDSQIFGFYNESEAKTGRWCLQEFVSALRERVIPKFTLDDKIVAWDVKFCANIPQQIETVRNVAYIDTCYPHMYRSSSANTMIDYSG